MHIGNGIIYVLFWPLYSEHHASKYVCASVPLMAAGHFTLVGMGIVVDKALVASATRTGDRKELLRGPLLYGTIIGLLTMVFWRDSPSGVAAIGVLCAGDGLADIVGRRLGASNRLPYSPNKSAAGSTACFFGGGLAAMACVLYLQSWGVLEQDLEFWRIALGSLLTAGVAAAVESLPLAEVDNWTVPVAAALIARLYFGY
ncbi:probable phytol kinase 1, chloroplastic [Coccomyxa sp. Obi]|nr:probable phytol kinase 1, chloroplastic [Coccomyxa sp. Obi]